MVSLPILIPLVATLLLAILLLISGQQFKFTVIGYKSEENATRTFKLNNIRWGDCSSQQDPLGQFTSFDIQPNPIVIPGNVSVGFSGRLVKDIITETPLRLKIQRRVSFIWLTIPCEAGFGSCEYHDFCSEWPVPGPDCLQVYQSHGIPCKCPFVVGNYTLPVSMITYVKGSQLPKWLEDGEYWVRASLANNGRDNALCIELFIEVTSS